MSKKLLSILTAAVMLMSFSSCADEAPVMPEPKKTSVVHTRPEAGENFYGYVNYDYLTHGQIPYGRDDFGTFANIEEEMKQYLFNIVDKIISSEPEAGSYEEMVKEMYNQYLDTEGRKKDGADIIKAAAKMIEDSSTTDELVKALGKIYQEYGIGSFFVFSSEPDLYDSSKPRLYLMNLNTCGNMKENFTKTDRGSEDIGDLTKKVLEFLEVDKAEMKDRINNVLGMINEIAYATSDSDKRLDVNIHYVLKDRSEFSKIFSNINTDDLLSSFGIGKEVDKLSLYELHQAEKINEFFTDEHLRALKDYALDCLIFGYGDILPPDMLDSDTSISSIAKNPDKAAKEFVISLLEEEIGIIYGREICTDDTMKAAEKMTSDLKESCRSLIMKCDRLGEDSKKKYISKLDNMLFLIGYNKEYVSPFEIVPAKDGGSLIANVIAVKRGKLQEKLDKLNYKTDRKTWYMSPITVNAVYNPLVNTVTIPAAMLSEASFSAKWSEYKNLGMLGGVIGHEMNHAFDSNGFLYDENGNYNTNWINETDKEKYNELMDRVKKYYSEYTILDVYNINGELTLGENIADIGALQCILNTTDNKEHQKEILEAQATQWASLVLVTDVVQQLEGDEHSPAEARSNAVAASMDEFYDIYGIKETDKMYVAPENRVKVW